MLGICSAQLLGKLLLQDLQHKDDEVSLKVGVSPGRIVSGHGPQMRHGHKSSRNRFDWHKVAMSVDTDSQLITAVEVLPGNAPYNTQALELVKQSKGYTGLEMEETIGNCAYGDGATRQTFVEAEHILIAKVLGCPTKAHFLKEDFKIDLEIGTCNCTVGLVTRTQHRLKSQPDGQGDLQQPWGFVFDAAVCGEQAVQAKCVASKKGKERTVSLHPQEASLQPARALRCSEAFAQYRKQLQISEHRLVQLVQLNIHQSRYFGRGKSPVPVTDGSHGGKPDTSGY